MRAMRGLLWEQWRQGQSVFVAVMAVELCYFLLVKAALGARESEELGTPALLLGLLAFILLLPNHCLKGYCWNIPARMSTLPVSGAKVFAAMLAYRLLVALCLGLCIDLGILVLANGTPKALPATMILVSIGLWSSFFSLAATRFGMGMGTVVAILPACLLFLLASALLSVPLYPALFLLGMLGAGFGTLKIVQSGAFSHVPEAAFAISGDSSGRWRSTLAGVVQEWRQMYCWLPLLGNLLSVMLVMLLGPSAMELFYMAPVVAAFGIGYYVYRYDELMPSVRLLRPLTTRQLSEARLLSGGLACLLTVGIGLAATLFLPASYDAEMPAIVVVLLWIALFAGRLLLMAGLAGVPIWLALAMLENEALGTVVVLACALLLVTAVYVTAWKRQIVRLPELALGLCIGVAMMLWLGESALPNDGIVAGLLAMLAMLPVAWVPLTIEWQRHR